MKRQSVVSGLVTLGAGFGAMNAFYLAAIPTTTRGLYTYWSATVGDAIALPILVGGLTEASIELGGALSVPRIVRWTAGVIGAGVGLATQIAWLADPNPDPNWTIPEPHTFTVAGHYHAGFTVALTAYVTSRIASCAWLLRKAQERESQPPVRALKALTTAGIAAAGFVALAVADNIGNRDKGASASSLIALGMAMAVIVGLAGWIQLQKAKRT